jgi:ankyrin repeat protein
LLKDCNGDTPLSLSAREGNPEIFSWFTGHLDYFKARGDYNYKGQTIEHIVCIYKKIDIVNAIKPRPDTRDFYGNLPIFYSIMQNDALMISKYFTKGREYFLLRNYKYETIFHIAARYNSLEAL